MIFDSDAHLVNLAWRYKHKADDWGISSAISKSSYEVIEKKKRLVRNTEEYKNSPSWVQINIELRKRSLEALCHKCQEVFVQSRRRPILSEMIKQFDSQWEANAMFPKLDSKEESYRSDRFREVCGR